jgi:hypothetical protein
MNGGESPTSAGLPDGRKSLVVYGNCQADNITGLLQEIEPIASRYRVSHISVQPGYIPPTPASIEDIATCDVLLEQFEFNVNFPHAELLPPDAARIRFPSTDLNLLWPLTLLTNPFNVTRSSLAPWGRFPYGDRVIVGMIESGAASADILAYYLQRWDEYAPDMNKMMRLERARLAFRDGKCDVQIADFIFDTFAKSRLFFTINHPSSSLLSELVARLWRNCDRFMSLCNEDTLWHELNRLAGKYPRGPRGSIAIPIHPRVAELLELQWYDPTERYEILGEAPKSYEEYLLAMISDSIAVRKERAELSPAGEIA